MNGTDYLNRTFTYDALGRLSGSAMSTGGQSSGNSWSERNISYDLDGNLLHLDRYQASSSTPEASLGFTVSGNRRTGWGYDANGNVTLDPLRNFEIRYNLLNLASEVRIPAAGNTPATDLSSSVFYADGTRVGVIDPGTGGWISRYIGSLIYSGSNGSEVLDGIQTEDGFVDCSGGVSNAQMQYFLRDHLGSVRVVAADRNTVLSRTDYLPFGSRMTGNGLPESATARSVWFGFSGKENEKWDAASGTQHWLRGERWQHFGARAYDPATCIWTGIDPLAEKYPGVSPYAYCAGNPVNLVDPDGSIWETVLDVASLVTGIHSFVSNVKEGNVGGAVVDGIGVVADAAAVLLPVVPGVAGYSIKAARGIDKGADALKAADKVVDGAKAVDKAGDVAKTTEKVKTYQTYTKTNQATGEVYVGRTSGTGSPEQNVKRRDQNHHMNKQGYGPAVLDKSSTNPDAIRGQEQFGIDKNGGAKVHNGTSGNKINGVSRNNPKRQQYENARRKEFGI